MMPFKINNSYKELIKQFEDFPIKGIKFYDTSQIFLNPHAYNRLIEDLIELFKDEKIDAIAAIEARGWPLAASIANLQELPVIYVYKSNKLPNPTHSSTAKAEYNSHKYEISLPRDKKFERVLILDDVIATGGTIRCAIDILESANCKPVMALSLIKIKKFVQERKDIKIPILSLLDK